MSKLDFSDSLGALDNVLDETAALIDTLNTRHGAKMPAHPTDMMQRAVALKHNVRYDRLLNKMSAGMTYDEAVTSCDTEDAVIAGSGSNTQQTQPAKPRQSIGLTDQEQTYRHLRQAALKALRIHEKDGTPVHMEWIDNVSSLFGYAGDRPSPIHSFGCIDHAKGFIPGNVRWQTRDDVLMAMGRRMVEYNGKQVTLTQLAKFTGVNPATIRARYEAGKRGADLWNEKRLNGKYICNIMGKEMTLAEVSRVFKIHPSTLRARVLAGATGDELLSRPKRGVKLEGRKGHNEGDE